MRSRALALAAVVACAVGWTARSVFSGEPPAQPPAQPPMDPAKMKEAWIEFAKPGEEQARLKPLCGEWKVVVKTTGFDGTVTETEGTASMSMILGDRYLRQESHGTFDGSPFEGRGLIGFDKGTKRWVSAWIDTMGTGVLVGDGEETEKGKSWTFKSTYHGPMGPMAMKDVLKVVSDKELSWESFMADMPTPMMSLKYTRKP